MSGVLRELRELERLEDRALAALRFVDGPTGREVGRPLRLRALDGEAVFVRNRSGLQVIASWTELAAHLPRRLSLALPRDPEGEGEEDSLFRPRVVRLFPAARSRTGPNWSVLRVTLTEDGTGDALGGGLVRVRRNGDVLARGLTDGRGEALVAAVGVPLLTFGEEEDAVVVDEVAVTVEAAFDPDEGTRMSAAALAAGEPPPRPEVDPDALDEDFDTLPQTALPLAVAARRSQAVSMAFDLP